MKKTWTVYNTL